MTPFSGKGSPEDHGALLDVARGLTETLTLLDTRLIAGERGVAWAPDYELARRIGHLGAHLAVVLSANAAGSYASAFAVLRACLEHHCVDELLFNATRYERVVEDVDDAKFADLERELQPLGDGPVIRRKGRRAFIVREGIPVRDGNDQVVGTVSPYYMLLGVHQPLVGKKADQEMLDDGVIDLAQLRVEADRNEDVYRRYLSWGAIRANLALNELWTEVDLRRLDVHYRFLGAFVHATKHGYDLIDRHQPPNHYCTELVLLYVAVIAKRELSSFINYLDRTLQTAVEGREELDRVLTSAEPVTAHLWFPGMRPHEFDRWREANRRGFLAARGLPPDLPPVPPNEISDTDIGYYDDPLARLEKLHQSANEIVTGYTYTAPW